MLDHFKRELLRNVENLARLPALHLLRVAPDRAHNQHKALRAHARPAGRASAPAQDASPRAPSGRPAFAPNACAGCAPSSPVACDNHPRTAAWRNYASWRQAAAAAPRSTGPARQHEPRTERYARPARQRAPQALHSWVGLHPGLPSTQSSLNTSRILPTPTSEPIARPRTPPRPKQLHFEKVM